jgi:hypothetical protein
MKHIHSLSCRNPCRLYIHLAFTCSIGPSSIVWSELGPAPPFSTNESAWSVMVTGTQSCVWIGPCSSKAGLRIKHINFRNSKGPLGTLRLQSNKGSSWEFDPRSSSHFTANPNTNHFLRIPFFMSESYLSYLMCILHHISDSMSADILRQPTATNGHQNIIIMSESVSPFSSLTNVYLKTRRRR